MRRVWHAVLLAAGVTAAAGCSKPPPDPLDMVIPTEMGRLNEIASVTDKLTSEQKQLLGVYLLTHKIDQQLGVGGIPPGTTVRAAIDDQRQRNESAKKEQVAKQLAEAIAKPAKDAKRAADDTALLNQLNALAEVGLASKTELAADARAGRYRPIQRYTFSVTNRTDRQIVGVAGTIFFTDVFGKTVGNVGVRVSQPVPPGKKIQWTGDSEFNRFEPTEVAVWNLEKGQYTTTYAPLMVVFADGTKVGSIPD